MLNQNVTSLTVGQFFLLSVVSVALTLVVLSFVFGQKTKPTQQVQPMANPVATATPLTTEKRY